MKNIFKIILAGLCLITATHSANACRQDEPIKLENIKHADTVIIAKIVAFKSFKDEVKTNQWIVDNPDLERQIIYSHAGLMLMSIEPLKGPVPELNKILLPNTSKIPPSKMSKIFVTGSTSVSPKASIRNLFPNIPYIFALMKKHGSKEWRQDVSQPISNELAVMQAPCSAPYIFEATAEQIKAAKKVLEVE